VGEKKEDTLTISLVAIAVLRHTAHRAVWALHLISHTGPRDSVPQNPIQSYNQLFVHISLSTHIIEFFVRLHSNILAFITILVLNKYVQNV